MSEWSVTVSVLSLLAGMPLGGWLWSQWLSQRKDSRKKALPLPGLWPLKGRRVCSSSEQEVWESLKVIFHDHAVMVKIPVLRFTQLREPQSLSPGNNEKSGKDGQLTSDQWLEMLGGLSTTFTICTMKGKVVGCVDVLERQEFGKSSRELKEALLLDCGIGYTEASAFNLPDAAVLRELFLGEIPAGTVDQQATRGGDSDFHADMAAFTARQASLTR